MLPHHHALPADDHQRGDGRLPHAGHAGGAGDDPVVHHDPPDASPQQSHDADDRPRHLHRAAAQVRGAAERAGLLEERRRTESEGSDCCCSAGINGNLRVKSISLKDWVTKKKREDICCEFIFPFSGFMFVKVFSLFKSRDLKKGRFRIGLRNIWFSCVRINMLSVFRLNCQIY